MTGDKELRMKLKKIIEDNKWSIDYTRRLMGMSRNTLENVLDVGSFMGWAPKTRDKVDSFIKKYEGK